MTPVRRAGALALAALALSSACAGDDGPGFRAVDLATGEPRTSADVRGEVTLLAGWATWCLPCERELPALEAALPEFTAAGVRVVAVNVDADTIDDDEVARTIARLAPSLEVWRDGDSSLLATYEGFLMPFSVMLDADGEVLRTWNGALDPDDVLPAPPG